MTLLTIDDIAAKVGERREYVRDKLVKSVGFPRPSLVLSQKIRKWALDDVDRWLDVQRRKWGR